MIHSATFTSIAIPIAHLRIFDFGDSSTPYSGQQYRRTIPANLRLRTARSPVFIAAAQFQTTRQMKSRRWG